MVVTVEVVGEQAVIRDEKGRVWICVPLSGPLRARLEGRTTRRFKATVGERDECLHLDEPVD